MKTSVGRRGKDLHFWMVEGEVMGRRGMGGKEDAMVQEGGRLDMFTVPSIQWSVVSGEKTN